MDQPGRREFITMAAGASFFLAGAASGRGQAPDPLLDALDLSQAELATVKRELEAGGPAHARAAFAEHLRTRVRPRWFFDPASPPAGLSPGTRQAADDALRHAFESVGIRHQFGAAIDWSYNPTTEPGSPDAADHEWTWQLNRHSAWSALAAAYTATKDTRYGRELAQQVADWVRDSPVPEAFADQRPRSRWRTIEAGIRMFSSWPDVYYRMVRQSDIFPDDVLLAMVDCMRRHADYLDAHPTGGNWLTMEADGQFHVGVIFPEFRNAERWRQNALTRLRRELDAQVYPDGAQKELTPGYHNVALRSFVSALRLAQLNDIPLPAGYQAGLERMYAMNLWAMSPDRDVPPFNDSWHVDVPRVLGDGLDLFPGRKAWLWIASGGKKGDRPDHTSHLFDWAGWAVMRSGWEPGARFLMMDCGPFGMGHQHEDKLSFVLHAYGSRLVFDAGSYAYDASDMRRYVLSARGHNVIHVDGMEQNRRGGPRERFVGAAPAELRWRPGRRADYASAEYGSRPEELWGPKRVQGVVHRREVVFVKPDYWVVVDTLTPPDGVQHTYETTFHLDAPEAVVDPASQTVLTRNQTGANLAIVPAGAAGMQARIVQGQKEPVLQGWLPKAHGVTGADPRPCACYTVRAAGPVRLVYAFVPAPPSRTAGAISVAAEAPAAGGTSVQVTRDGRNDSIVVSPDGTVGLRRS